MKDDNIGYLLHTVSFAIDRHSNDVLEKRLKIGFSQFKIMLALSYLDGISQKEIARRLGQSEASISRQIKLLNESLMIQIKQDAGNKRLNKIYLSKKGRLKIERATNALNEYYEPMFSRLTIEERQELIETLIKIKSFL